MMQEDKIIDVEKLSLKAGYRYLLKDITWQVKPGEHWVVFGMNGSGKTTLLSLLAGYKQATSGRLSVYCPRLNGQYKRTPGRKIFSLVQSGVA